MRNSVLDGVKERPIIFSAEMVRAIIEGRKTQTRRIVKPQPSNPEHSILKTWDTPDLWYGSDGDPVADHTGSWWSCPYGKPGDRLWVRETFGVWRKTSYDCDEFEVGKEATRGLTLAEHEPIYGHSDLRIAYRSDADDEGPWYPSIFMPRWASRITLEVTEVRVQRLQDITASDCEAEGIRILEGDRVCHAGETKMDDAIFRDAFGKLWISINGPGSWDANPWIWAISFKRVTA